MVNIGSFGDTTHITSAELIGQDVLVLLSDKTYLLFTLGELLKHAEKKPQFQLMEFPE